MKQTIRISLILCMLAQGTLAQTPMPQPINPGASAQAMQQAVAVATLVGCTQKQAGKQATEAFYNKMQVVVKQAEAYCKAAQAAQARSLLVNTFHQNSADPVVVAAVGCYTRDKVTIDTLAGPQLAPKIAQYIHALQNPNEADRDFTDQNVCQKKS